MIFWFIFLEWVCRFGKWFILWKLMGERSTEAPWQVCHALIRLQPTTSPDPRRCDVISDKIWCVKKTENKVQGPDAWYATVLCILLWLESLYVRHGVVVKQVWGVWWEEEGSVCINSSYPSQHQPDRCLSIKAKTANDTADYRKWRLQKNLDDQ